METINRLPYPLDLVKVLWQLAPLDILVKEAAPPHHVASEAHLPDVCQQLLLSAIEEFVVAPVAADLLPGRVVDVVVPLGRRDTKTVSSLICR